MTKVNFNPTLCTGEMFKFNLQIADDEFIRYEASGVHDCYGMLTRHSFFNWDRPLKELNVTVYFNIFDKDQVKPYSANVNSDIYLCNYRRNYDIVRLNRISRSTVIGNRSEFINEFNSFTKRLIKFVPFTANIYTTSVDFIRGDCMYRCNYAYRLQFSNVYMHEVFFVMDLIRKLVQIDTRQIYYFCKDLEEKGWHNMDLINLLLMTDCWNIMVPSDQKLGTELPCSHTAGWVTPESFKHIRQEINNRGTKYYHRFVFPIKENVRRFDDYVTNVEILKNPPYSENFIIDMVALENLYQRIIRNF